MIPLLITIEKSTLTGPDPSLSPFQEWREADGAVIAIGYTDTGRHWLLFPGLATFQFSDTSDAVVAAPAEGTPSELIWDTYLRAALPLVLHSRGQEALHASAVVGPGGVVAFCAHSQTGKSTLAYGLTQRGYPPFSDDAVVLKRAGDDWLAVSYPFQFRLRAAVATHFAEDGAQLLSRSLISNSAAPAAGEPQPLAALVLLTKLLPDEASEPAAFSRLSPAAALPLVLSHAYCFSLEDPERKQKMAMAYVDLVTSVPTYDLRYAGTLEALAEVLDGIEAIMVQLAPAPESLGGESKTTDANT